MGWPARHSLRYAPPRTLPHRVPIHHRHVAIQGLSVQAQNPVWKDSYVWNANKNWVSSCENHEEISQGFRPLPLRQTPGNFSFEIFLFHICAPSLWATFPSPHAPQPRRLSFPPASSSTNPESRLTNGSSWTMFRTLSIIFRFSIPDRRVSRKRHPCAW